MMRRMLPARSLSPLPPTPLHRAGAALGVALFREAMRQERA
jgi:hypothetical protein